MSVVGWRYPCVEDSVRPCPYRYRIKDAGILNVASADIMRCCRYHKQASRAHELINTTNRQEQQRG